MESTSASLVITDSSIAGHVIAKTPDKFSLFPSFPVEIQCKIYLEAFPEPRIVDFNFYIKSSLQVMGTGKTISFDPRRCVSGILPLLLACSNSKDELFRNFHKVEIDISNSIKLRHSRDLLLTYIRPTIDILMVPPVGVLELYNLGGHINWGNLTHLVLGDDHEIFWVRQDLEDEEPLPKCRLAKFYTLLSTHCPALRKLSLTFGSFWNTGSRKNCKLVDITEGCVDLDWVMGDVGVQISPGYDLDDLLDHHIPNARAWMLMILGYIQNIHNDTRRIMLEFDRFLNFKDGDSGISGEKTLNYWKNRRPAVVFLAECKSHFDSSPSCCQSEQPELYVNWVGASVKVHKDLTPLNKYKGLAQLFDGAAW